MEGSKLVSGLTSEDAAEEFIISGISGCDWELARGGSGARGAGDRGHDGGDGRGCWVRLRDRDVSRTAATPGFLAGDVRQADHFTGLRVFRPCGN